MDSRFLHSTQATTRRLGSDLFLANPDFGTLYRASGSAPALWQLLARPTSVTEAVEVFRQAFPDEDAEDLETEITDLFFDFYEEGLIVEAPENERSG